MPRIGGESGKLGVHYESIWTVAQLIELILDGAVSSRLKKSTRRPMASSFELSTTSEEIPFTA